MTPTYEQVQEALSGRVIALAQFCEYMLGFHPAAFLGFRVATWPVSPRDFDVTGLPIAENLRPVYEYAYHATLDAKHPDSGFLDDESMELLRDFADLVTASNGEIEHFLLNLDWSFERPRQWEVVDELIELYFARANLDDGSELTVEQVALLAGMSERSVRNAMSLPGEGGLAAKRQSGRSGEKETVIENAEARRWLAGRRSFRPTKRAWAPDAPEPLPQRVESHRELMAFIRQRIDSLYGSVAAAAAATEIPEEWIQRARNLDYDFDEPNIERLARLTNVDEGWMTEQLVRVRLPRKFAELAKRLSSK